MPRALCARAIIHYEKCLRAGRCGHRPLRTVTSSAVGRDDVGIVPYEKSSLGGREDDTVIYIFLCKHPLHQQQQAEARNPQDADDDGIEPAQPQR